MSSLITVWYGWETPKSFEETVEIENPGRYYFWVQTSNDADESGPVEIQSDSGAGDVFEATFESGTVVEFRVLSPN